MSEAQYNILILIGLSFLSLHVCYIHVKLLDLSPEIVTFFFFF